MNQSRRSSIPRNLLVTRFSALGDVAMTVPVVYSLCATNPQTKVILVTKKLPSTLFLNRPDNLEIVVFNPARWKGVGGLWRLAAHLKKSYDIDAYADLHDVLRTKFLRLFMRLRGVRVRKIHKGRSGKRALTRSRNKVMLPLTTSRARYREVFWRMGMPREDLFDNLFTAAHPVDRSVYAKASAPRENRASDGMKWIAIAPFAAHAGKVYPLDLMRQVVDTLAKREGYRLFLFGAGEKERSVLAEWHAAYPSNTVNMAELNLGLASELALLYDCDAIISMDSANMHLASLVGLRVVSIWGATHPYCGFLGWRQKKGDAVQLDMVCRPCSVFGNKPCMRGDWHCLRGIQPSYVVDKLDHALNRR